MKQEEQFCTASQGRQLQHHGIQMQALFYWYTGDTGTNSNHLCYSGGKVVIYDEVTHPAYSGAELGELLPEQYATWKDDHSKDWRCGKFGEIHSEIGTTEAQVKAAMLLHILKN